MAAVNCEISRVVYMGHHGQCLDENATALDVEMEIIPGSDPVEG